MTSDALIADAINAKRAAGHDPAFEAIMRKPWYCPYCRASKTVLDVTVPVGHPEKEFGCNGCGMEGIAPIGGDGRNLLRQLLKYLVPFNRSGAA